MGRRKHLKIFIFPLWWLLLLHVSRAWSPRMLVPKRRCVSEALVLSDSSSSKNHTIDFFKTRRGIFSATGAAVFAMGAPTVALARGLIRFPLDRPLSNRYWLVRAGESRADARDVVASNPVGKADLENSLTERGRQQAREAAKELQAYGVTAPILWYSIWAKATQTASVISDVMLITSERRNAEYTYLDGRGMGAFEGTPLGQATETIGSLDASGQSPPETEDGTPAESAKDLSVRVLQMVSIIETLASAQDVVVVATDSDLLSVWQAAIAGAPLEGHRAFGMKQGEVRFLEYEIQSKSPAGPSVDSVLTPARTAATTTATTTASSSSSASWSSSSSVGVEASRVRSGDSFRERMAKASRIANENSAKRGGDDAGRLESLAAELRAAREKSEEQQRAQYDAERAAEAEAAKVRAAKAAEAKAEKGRAILEAQAAAKREAKANKEAKAKKPSREAKPKDRVGDTTKLTNASGRLIGEEVDTLAGAAVAVVGAVVVVVSQQEESKGELGGSEEVSTNSTTSAMGKAGDAPEELEVANLGVAHRGKCDESEKADTSPTRVRIVQEERGSQDLTNATDRSLRADGESREREEITPAAAAAAAARRQDADTKAKRNEDGEREMSAEAVGRSLESVVQEQLTDAVAAVQASESQNKRKTSVQEAAEALNLLDKYQRRVAEENYESQTISSQYEDAAAIVVFDGVFEDMVDSYEESWLNVITEEIAPAGSNDQEDEKISSG